MSRYRNILPSHCRGGYHPPAQCKPSKSNYVGRIRIQVQPFPIQPNAQKSVPGGRLIASPTTAGLFPEKAIACAPFLSLFFVIMFFVLMFFVCMRFSASGFPAGGFSAGGKSAYGENEKAPPFQVVLIGDCYSAAGAGVPRSSRY